MRIAWWLPMATNTLSERVINIACPLQQGLYERARMLCYTYIACLVVRKLFHNVGQDPENWTFLSKNFHGVY
jgi:hypothetical protein